MSGLFGDDTLTLYLKLKEAMKQYVRDAMPGGALNPEVKPQDTLDAAALSLTPVPVVGDIAGLLADGYRYATDPSSRTPLNYGLSALGALPFVPAMGGMTKLGKTAPEPPRAEAMRVAQANAAKPVSEGGLGLRPNNTPMERARAMGVDIQAYRGTSADEVIAGNNSRGGWVSASDSPKEASFYAISSAMKKTGNKGIDGANVMPLLVKPDSVFSSGIGSNELLVKNPANVRSRFAAFDPARINEADLLGQVRPDFLPYLFGTGLLGAYGVSQLEDK